MPPNNRDPFNRPTKPTLQVAPTLKIAARKLATRDPRIPHSALIIFMLVFAALGGLLVWGVLALGK